MGNIINSEAMNWQEKINPWNELEHKSLFQAFMRESTELKCGAWTPLKYIIYAFGDFCVKQSVSAEDVSGYTCDVDKRTALLNWLNEYDVHVTGSIAHPVAVGLKMVKWP